MLGPLPPGGQRWPGMSELANTLWLVDLAENAPDGCAMACRARAAGQRVITVCNSEQERRAELLGLEPLDRITRVGDVGRVIGELGAKAVVVTSRRLLAASEKHCRKAGVLLGLAAVGIGGKALGRVAGDASGSVAARFVELTELLAFAPGHGVMAGGDRVVLRQGLGVRDGELAIGLIGPWPGEDLAAGDEPPCKLFSRVIGMLALGDYPVVGLADSGHSDMGGAATFAQTVEDQFELIGVDGPVEAALAAMDGLVWLGSHRGGSVAALAALRCGVPVVAVADEASRAVQMLAGEQRASGQVLAKMVLAPDGTMASIGSRVMEALGLVEPARRVVPAVLGGGAGGGFEE